MKHLKLFENFSEKTKIEIELWGKNPDCEYGCTAVGVGNTPREAAMFALQASCDWIINVDDSIYVKDLKEFNDVVGEVVLEEELEEVLQMLEMGEIKQEDTFMGKTSFFSSHGDDVEAEAKSERALPGATIGGFILDSYVNEYYK